MALTSPGVQVSVIDESFYTPAEPGTVPMVFVATAANKQNAAGTGIAQGTLAANAGTPYLLTSQRDLADTFGDPVFKTDSNNNPINGGELNEYGLQAAYSFLGVSNRAYVVRADIDLDELVASATAPAANPANGTYWLDTQVTAWGIQEWNGLAVTSTNGQTFTNKTPIVITDATQLVGGSSTGAPLTSVGEIGDYAVVATTSVVKMYYRTPGNAPGVTAGSWVEIGGTDWISSWPTIQGSGTFEAISETTANFLLNGTTITVNDTDTAADVVATINGFSIPGVVAAVVDGRIELYSDGSSSGADDSSLGGPVIIAEDGDTILANNLKITPGTYYPPSLQISKHTSVPEWKTDDTYSRPTGSVWIKTTQPNAGARWRMKVWNSATQLWESVEAPIYSSANQALYELDQAGGGTNIPVGGVYVLSNVAGDAQPLATFKIYKRESVGSTTIRSSKIVAGSFSATTYTFTVASTDAGQEAFNNAITVEFTATGVAGDAAVLAGAINSANIENVTAEVDSLNRVVINHTQGGEIKFVDTDSGLAAAGFVRYTNPLSGTPNLYYVQGTDGSTNPKQLQASNWRATRTQAGITSAATEEVAFYTASEDPVTATTTDGSLWYNSIVDEVDIMIHNGTTWVGYKATGSQLSGSDPNGPIVSATRPTLQSEGSALVNGDLWIDTSDLENYPQIYKFNANKTSTPIANRWELVDKSDQTTENGVLFADARYNTAGANSNEAGDIVDLLESNFLDTDAPDPALYPKGMLLFNTRRSGFNVKRYVRNYVDVNADNLRYDSSASPNGLAVVTEEAQDAYFEDRWVTESANNIDGSGSFGRNAQRKVVVQALQATLNSNDDIRDDESRIFNLMATPGYPELIGEMVSLNYDRGLTAFVLGDSPARLTPDATSLNEWATNVNLAVEDNDDGLVTRDEYLGIFYPWGFTSDNFGNNVVVPPSHMMLRTIALSDQVSFPWFAPAGTRRGGITNASSTGYIDAEGEFVAVALNEGQRDTLYAQNVNPITFITGAGLVNFGQKTRARGASSLDRINVARLVIYLRSQLNQLAKPYIFEPNDKITRDEIKQAAESLLLELVGQRGIYDYLVVCDESNNTPNRIDRNELYLDIAIEPVKAVEFIYIPLRLKNTGEIAGL